MQKLGPDWPAQESIMQLLTFFLMDFGWLSLRLHSFFMGHGIRERGPFQLLLLLPQRAL